MTITRTMNRALMYVIGRKFSNDMRIVDVRPSDSNWAGYPTYKVRYEFAAEPGVYINMEFLPSKETEKELNNALHELEYQAEGKEFPV